jgi:hypothetical protein
LFEPIGIKKPSDNTWLLLDPGSLDLQITRHTLRNPLRWGDYHGHLQPIVNVITFFAMEVPSTQAPQERTVRVRALVMRFHRFACGAGYIFHYHAPNPFLKVFYRR